MFGKRHPERSIEARMTGHGVPSGQGMERPSPIRKEFAHFRLPQGVRDTLATAIPLILVFETLPLAACSGGGTTSSPSSATSSYDGDLSTGGGEAEHVVIEFLPNAPEGVAVRGGTPPMTVKMDNEDSSLPECGYAADGYEFCGWSTAANGESDPVTGIPAISVPDRQSLTNLDYDLEQVTNREGQEVVTSDPASLAEYIQDGRVYLYAQWKKTETPQAPQTPTGTIPDGGDEKRTGGEASPVATKVARHAGLEAVTVEGSAEPSEASIAASLEQQGIQADDATRIAIKAVRPASPVKNAQPPEATATDTLDGTSIGPVRMAWVTQDTVDNGNESILYLKPDNDLPQAVVMRMNYSFSGEHDYEPGDINITIPTSMFHKRGGAETGELTIPFPENPKASDDFNWIQQNDTYVLTNTRKMSAATAGYIEFQIGNLRPHEIVDMSTSDEFWAHVEVTTWAGNPLSKTSNKITAQIDTEEVVRSANKYSTGVQYVSPSEIDSPLVNPSEEAYVLVSWYMYSYVVGNTDFTLSSVDTKTDSYQGFIVSPTSGGDGQSYTNPNHFTGYTSGSTDGTAGTSLGYQTVTVAYPFSQFHPDTQYTFENRIDYTLTETDPATTDPVDERKVTHATATASRPWSWQEPKFDAPIGHFMVNKIGNDGSAGTNPSPYWAHPYTSYMWNQLDTNVHNCDDYYGIYPSALNQIQDGNDVEVAYTVESIGYLLPWTLKDGGNPAKISDYGQRSVRMDTYDTDDTKNSPIWLDGNIPLSRGADYRYTAVEFPKKPSIGLPRAINLGADGQIALRYAGDGTVEYAPDPADAHIPVIHLKAKVGGVWQELATADWRTGSLVLTASSAGSVIGNRVLLPANTEQVMTSVDSTNAYVYYYIRPVISVKADGALGNMIPSLLSPGGSPNYTPSIGLYNSTYMKAYDSHGTELVDIHKTAMDSLRGYSTDVAVNPAKQGTQTVADVDYDRRLVTVHYSAQVQEQSYIPDVATYQQAIAEGRITPETEGVWYDLLPKGMNPVLSTIRLRSLDSIHNAYAIRNYKDSGRTLLVVEANLTPNPKEYTDAGVRRYMDAPEISFDATYGFEAIKDYGGDNIHNVIAFESLSRNPIGTVPNHGGEPDDPRSNNNVRTAESFANDTERNAMTGIDPAHPGNRFVYAGVTQNLTALSAARTSLAKDIDVYNDNKGWTKGTYDDIRKAYEGGPYSYRLRMMSDADTISKDLVIYDSLENFHAGQGNDPADINAPRWQGTFTGVDVSQLIAKGVAPVVYYSTIPNLTLAADTTTNNMMNINLRDSSVWIDETTFRNSGGSLAEVKAIAIDCSKDANGNDFKLQPTESISAVVSMRAPSEEQAGTAELIAQDAHAYNNVFLGCTSVDARTGTTARTGFIRFDYTKVGLKEHRLGVTKEWDDGDNRDGLRPTSLTVRLYANGQATNKSLSLNDANSWQGAFEHMAYADAGGQPIRYTVVEEPVPTGYIGGVTQDDAGFVIHNKHVPETIDISGHKTWIGGENEIPTQIYLSLLANGTEARRVRVTPDSEGSWNYSFTNLYKYENGQPIDYQFREEDGLSRRWVCAHDGANIVNTYHPYGDLKIQKTALNQTSVSATAKFKFFFEFRDETDELIPDKFPCALPGGATIQVGNGDFVELRGGESAIVREIPDGTKYRVTEEQRDGYSITQSSGLSGEIFGNSMQEASVTNKYAAKGSVNLTARKHLSGRDMQNYQFRAELRNDLGAVIRLATNKVDSADPAYGTFQFGTMRYTEQDIGTHEYVMAETVRGLGGYTYDATVYKVIVMVTDNGDGTLNTVVTYKTADGTQVVEQPQFNNQYHATGSIQLKAWKQLKGRQLQDQEFAFELRDENGQRVGNVVRNNADGEIVFDAIHFDESHVGKTYRYVAHEVNGSDDTVVYSTDAYGYQVTVMDNGDGTLSFSSDMVDIVDGELTSTIIDIVPVFTNTLVPGSLRIEKHVDDVPEGHEGDKFRFKIRLSGEDVEDGQYEYTHEQLVPPEPTYTNGYAYAVLEDDGTLTFFRSEDTYPTGPDQAVLDVAGNSYTGHVYANIENQTGTYANSAPWYMQRSSIKKATIAPNQVISPMNCAAWFWGCSNLSDTSGLSVLDTSNVTNMSNMFFGCSGASFTAPDVSNWDTSKVTDMNYMFQNCYGAAFTAPDVSKWNTSSVTTMSSMFENCHGAAFTAPDVSEWNTSKVTDMSWMFRECSGAAFTTPDVSEWDTSNVTNMSGMFWSCYRAAFTVPDVSDWNTSNVTDMHGMFFGCYGTGFTSIDLSKWNISKVTNMSQMFQRCYNLETIYVASDADWNASATLTSHSDMFKDCSKLKGGNGTTYNSSYIDKTRARVDGLGGQSGYFTAKNRTSSAYVLSGLASVLARAYPNDESGQSQEPVHEQIPTGLVAADEDNAGIEQVFGSVLSSLHGMLSPRTALAEPDTRRITVTYDAGTEGAFSNGSPTNVVEYDVDDNTEQTKYSHTANLSDDKTQHGDYANNLSTKDVLSIPGASSLHVVLEYGTEDNYDMVYVFQGEYTGTVMRNMSAGQLSSYTGSRSTPITVELDVPGDTVTFAFYSDANGQYWGYHATVTGVGPTKGITSGSYEKPVPHDSDFVFVGWRQGADDPIDPDAVFESTTLTARYENPWQDFTGNGSSFRWYVDEGGNLRIRAINGTEGTMRFASYSDVPWPKTITSVSVDQGHTIHAIGTFNRLFQGCASLTTADLTGLDTSGVTDMSSMFSSCSSLVSLTFPETFDTSSVTNMSSMFSSCSSLVSLTFPETFNTSSVTNMMDMFSSCSSLVSLTFPETFDTSSVTNMSGMFASCTNLMSLNVSSFDTHQVTDMDNMFCGCQNLTSIDISNFNTYRVTNMSEMFSNSGIISLDLSNFVTPDVTDMSYMFYLCSNLRSLDVSNLDTSSVTTMQRMFGDCSSLISLDLSSFSTPNLRIMIQMFDHCSSLVNVDLSSFNTPRLEAATGIFEYCSSLKTIDISNLDTSQLTYIGSWFLGCSSLETVDLSNLDTSQVTGIQSLFSGCSNLKAVDLSSFDTSQVTDISDLFSGCSNLKAVDLSSFDTRRVQYMTDVFRDCNQLASITLGPWNALRGQYDQVCVTDLGGDWENIDTGAGPKTFNELINMMPLLSQTPELMGRWIRVVPGYRLAFDSNGGTGSLSAIKVSPSDLPYTIPATSFRRFGYIQTGWSDDFGNSYGIGGTIPANRYPDDTNVTLHAVWEEEDTSVTLSNGMFEIELGANESATFANCIPAGTSYSIYEEMPEGWVLVSQGGVTGNIPAAGVATASFTNRYAESSTSVTLVGNKTLDDAEIPADMFSFELREDGIPIETVTNVDGGGILFSPIVYHRSDLGTHTYTVAEVIRADGGISYDRHIETVTVEVTRNGSKIMAVPSYDSDNITFENHTLPGAIQLTKVTNGRGNPEQEFEFEVELKNTDLSSLVPSPTTTAAGTALTQLTKAWDALCDLFAPHEAYALTSGWQQSGTCEWHITDGELVIRPLDNRTRGMLDNWWTSSPPWSSSADSITSVRFEGIVSTETCYRMFVNFRNLTSLDLTGLDTSQATNMNGMFLNCSSLVVLDLSNFDTSKVTSMDDMFSGCSNLTAIDLAKFDTFNVSSMNGMFADCRSLASLDLSNFDTSRVQGMYRMFDSCSSLPSLDLSSFNTSKVTDMGVMFSGCSRLSSLDLSSFDTSNVTGMNAMFVNCSNLVSINLSSFNTSKVTAMSAMFAGCVRLMKLDLSGFDTSNVWSIDNMLAGCGQLSSITLGARNALQGRSNNFAYLQSPPADITTGKWVHLDHPAISKTSEELMTMGPDLSSSPDFIGTWVWETNPQVAIVQFDPQGGSIISGSARDIQTNTPYADVAVPAVKQGSQTLLGWNSQPDGTGTDYGIPEAVTPVEGTTTYYAQWLNPMSLPSYTVVHRQECGESLCTFIVTEKETHRSSGTVTIEPKSYYGFETPSPQTVTIAEDGSTVVTFDYPRTRFIVTLSAGSAGTQIQSFIGGVKQQLKRAPVVTGKRFIGWTTNSDGTGECYADQQAVAFDRAPVTLYAYYVDEQDAPEQVGTSAVYHVKVKAGQTVTIPNIPAGTSYEIREVNVPDGWTQQGTIQGGTGVSQAATIAHATATNQYAASGSFSLQAYKKFEGQNISDGQFSFELIDMANPSQVLQTVTNDGEDTRKTLPDGHTGEPVPNPNYGWAPITFQDVQLTAPGTYTYKIREKTTGTNPTTIYDTHEELVTVTATDNYDGTLTTTVTPDNDGTRFTNRTHGGTLKLAKIAQGDTDASAGTQFEFDLSLSTSGGVPIPDAAYEMRTRIPATPSGVDPQGSTPTSNFSPRDGEPVVTYDANGGHFEGGYAKNSVSYTVGSTGTTPSQGTYADPFPPASDKEFGGWFTTEGCEDGSEFLPSSLTETQTSVKAYAKWIDSPQETVTSLQVTGGHATIPAHGGEVVTIPNLPAGTHYMLTEKASPGWTQEGIVNTDGTIEAAGVSSASVTNRYSASGSFFIEATKTVDGIELEDGSFSFVVTNENGELIARATNDAEGHVKFSNLTIDPSWAGKTLTFHVTEEAGDMSGVQYDRHVEDVSVTFSDDGHGVLSADVEYDGDGCSFLNTRAIGLPMTGLGGASLLGAGLSFALVALAGLTIAHVRRRQQHDGGDDPDNLGRVREERELMRRRRGWHAPTKRVSPPSDARFNRNRRH